MKKILFIVIALIVVAGGSFYGGAKYNQNKTTRSFSQGNQQKMQGLGADAVASLRGTGGIMTSGDIISKDDKSVTVKLRDGGSKIIFYSSNTDIGKFVSGNSNDLEINKSIIVSGKTNSDGSVTAQSIQLRNQLPAKQNQ